MADQRTIGERGHIEEGSVDSSRCQGSGHALHRLAVVLESGAACKNEFSPTGVRMVYQTHIPLVSRHVSVGQEALRNASIASFVPRLMGRRPARTGVVPNIRCGGFDRNQRPVGHVGNSQVVVGIVAKVQQQPSP